MKVSAILTVASLFLAGLVKAAPVFESAASGIATRDVEEERNFYWESALSSMKDITQKIKAGEASSIVDKYEKEFIDQIKKEFQKHGLMKKFGNEQVSLSQSQDGFEEGDFIHAMSEEVSEEVLLELQKASREEGGPWKSHVDNNELIRRYEQSESAELLNSQAVSPPEKKQFDEIVLDARGFSKRDSKKGKSLFKEIFLYYAKGRLGVNASSKHLGREKN